MFNKLAEITIRLETLFSLEFVTMRNRKEFDMVTLFWSLNFNGFNDIIKYRHTPWIATRFKGSSNPNHFIFEINVGKSRIRHTTTLQLNDEVLDRLKIDEDDVIQIQSRSMSDLTLSDIDFKNKMALVRTTLKNP